MLAPGAAEFSLWGAWLAVWTIAARGAAPAAWTESRRSRLAHVLPLGVAAGLFFASSSRLGALGARWLPETAAVAWTGVGVTAVGLAFAIWARFRLGRNWSAEVQLKRDHRLIRGGPYEVSRHPIYTGMLGGFFGAALAAGDVRGLVCLALAFAAFWVKSRREEAVLRERFGAEYDSYRREVKALIPFAL
jgi:protein-S-isoprenylcysteine O-methyltransferase Ste14